MLRSVFAVFWNAPGARPVWIAFLMLVASLTDLISMGALVPLVAQFTSDGGDSQSAVASAITRVLSTIGIAPTFGHLLIFVGVALVTKSLVALLAMTFAGISVADVTTSIRTRMLSAMVGANWRYFTERKPGELASQISAQSGLAGQAYMASAAFVTTAISGLGLVTAAALISPTLLFISVAAMSLLIWPLRMILKIAERASNRQWSATNDLTSGVEDVVNNMKPLKSMGLERRFTERFNDSIRRLRSVLILTVSSGYATFYGQDIMAAVLVVSAVWICVSVLQTPLSQFFAFGVVFYQMVDVVKRTQQSLQAAVVQSAGYQGVMETIRHGEAHAEQNGTQKAPELAREIRFEDVSFSYTAKPVLSHVSLVVPAGAISVLIGPSGSGKTTMVDLIIGFNRPTKGRILIDGADLADIDLQTWRRQIGYVPQELTLLRGTVAENIALGQDFSVAEILEALGKAGARDFVEALPGGIHADIGTMGAKLSGGQRQRISLARALVHKPRLLLLDEVTSALDEETEAEICSNIKSLAGTHTILAITHRPAWRSIAQQTWRIAHGKATLERNANR